MEQENNKKKMILPMVLGITVLSILVLGATYAYFTVGTSNNFGSKTISATTPEVGSVTLSSGESLSLNMTSELMMEENIGTYYATTTGVPSTTLTEADIATATVTGAGNFNCTYDLTITPSATNSLYTAFTGMTGHSINQIALLIGNHIYDFYNYDFSSPIVLHETFNNVTSSASKSIKASLMFKNTNFDQNALQGKDITFTFTASNLSCTAIEIDPLIGKLVTLDNQSGIYYRVLWNETGTTYMLLRMNNDLGTTGYNSTQKTIVFEDGNSYQKYSGSNLDTYMNSTYYNTLSTNIKNAIVDKNIDQKVYEHIAGTISNEKGDTRYTYQHENAFRGNNNYYAVNYVSKVNVGTRHVYALEVEDIYKYMSALKGSPQREITSEELNNMFFNTTGITTENRTLWLRSARVDSFNAGAWCIKYADLTQGNLNYAYSDYNYGIRPAFLIDLSKVDYASASASCSELGNAGC